MIKEFVLRDKKYTFYNAEQVTGNTYTVIVGKNGSGKSTLLGSLAWNLLSRPKIRVSSSYSRVEYQQFERGAINMTKKPDHIIAVSTSPFDKFPLFRRNRSVKGYTYLGLRDLNASNFGLAYLSKIISSLIENVQNRPIQAAEISKVLNYLGYHETMRIRFDYNSTRKVLRQVFEASGQAEAFNDPELIVRELNKDFFFDEEYNLDQEKVSKLTEILPRLANFPYGLDIHVEINQAGIYYHAMDAGSMVIDPLEFIFLIKAGLFRLHDVLVQRLYDSSVFSIRDASSGEQSVILTFLGIASQITNNSLICIDEPEVCLHPQWQEKYIQLLGSTFSNYEGCQFIIATHSPQIISRLNEKNCFILSMERGLAENASLYIRNSADFQLARLFNSPGYKNEYLSRIALNIFVRVSKSKKFDSIDREDYEFIRRQSAFLDTKDPVYDLYLSIKELSEHYG